jgi:hypothetical protein
LQKRLTEYQKAMFEFRFQSHQKGFIGIVGSRASFLRVVEDPNTIYFAQPFFLSIFKFSVMSFRLSKLETVWVAD